MKVYVFGNEDTSLDNLALKVAKKIKNPKFSFEFVKPNADFDFDAESDIIILDNVRGLQKVSVLSETDIDKFKLPPRGSVHDFDLGFQLKYLMKLGKIKSFKIIGLPQHFEFSSALDSVTSILEML